MSHTAWQGLTASFYGLGGVFVVLILFYFLTKLMMSFCKEKKDK